MFRTYYVSLYNILSHEHKTITFLSDSLDSALEFTYSLVDFENWLVYHVTENKSEVI